MRNDPSLGNQPSRAPPGEALEWRTSPGLTSYPEALAQMEHRADAVREKTASELVWLLEHPPLYTAGTSSDPAELFNPLGFPVYEAGRGGRYTYHGPGQRVGYLVLDLGRRDRDIRRFVRALEAWLIAALARLDVEAFALPERIGIWTLKAGREAKLGAIGVRVRRWVTLHGFSVNIDPELSHFSGIVPCGIADRPVTSLAELGLPNAQARFDRALHHGLGDFLLALDGESRRLESRPVSV
jgi:lipoyl(octanoyl) transferase